MPYISFFLSKMIDLNNKKVWRCQYSPNHRLYPPNEITELEMIELYTYAGIVKNHFDQMFFHDAQNFLKKAENEGIKKWDFGHALLYVTKYKKHKFDHDPHFMELINKVREAEREVDKYGELMISMLKEELHEKSVEHPDGRTIQIQPATIEIVKGFLPEPCIDTLFWKLRMFE
jgi:hypothetical protein